MIGWHISTLRTIVKRLLDVNCYKGVDGLQASIAELELVRSAWIDIRLRVRHWYLLFEGILLPSERLEQMMDAQTPGEVAGEKKQAYETGGGP